MQTRLLVTAESGLVVWNEKELPHFVVHLEMTGPDRLLPGGHIHA